MPFKTAKFYQTSLFTHNFDKSSQRFICNISSAKEQTSIAKLYRARASY